jgi:plastocyanin
MSPHRRTPRLDRLGLAILGIAWLVTTLPVKAQPHAIDPLPTPLFSVDRSSPLNANNPGYAAGVLEKPGPGLRYPRQGMGLYSDDDDLDALSYDRMPAVSAKPCFLFLFGVDRQSVGGPPPDQNLVDLGRPFNVKDQAERHQAAADLYMTLGSFTLEGSGTPGSECASGSTGNNVLAVNQGDTGGVDSDLSPKKNPVQRMRPTEPEDDADSAAYPPTGGKGRDDSPRTEALFFSVTADSPSLPLLPFLPGQPGTQSGADVFADPDPSVGGNETLYAPAAALGLIGGPEGDDIDALVVLDNGNGTLDPGTDRILFSLARNSPSLGANFSPADVFLSRGNGTKALFASAAELGLNPLTDNLDCLEVLPFDPPASDYIFAHAVFLVWPGDYTPSPPPPPPPVLTQTDCDAFDDCYGGVSVVHTVQVGLGPVFSPQSLTIETGDVVQWVWLESGHNVVSGVSCTPNGAFNSGPASDVGSTFDVTFDEAMLNAFPVPGAVYYYFSQSGCASGMTGEIHVVPNLCAVFDLDFDGDVDAADWVEFQAVYTEATDGDLCMISIAEFVDALLGCPQKPAHTCMADINGDGAADGLDVQGYVDAILGP